MEVLNPQNNLHLIPVEKDFFSSSDFFSVGFSILREHLISLILIRCFVFRVCTENPSYPPPYFFLPDFSDSQVASLLFSRERLFKLLS